MKKVDLFLEKGSTFLLWGSLYPQPYLQGAILVIFGLFSIVANTSYITVSPTKKNLCLT
jgi:hypothetical protein